MKSKIDFGMKCLCSLMILFLAVDGKSLDLEQSQIQIQNQTQNTTTSIPDFLHRISNISNEILTEDITLPTQSTVIVSTIGSMNGENSTTTITPEILVKSPQTTTPMLTNSSKIDTNSTQNIKADSNRIDPKPEFTYSTTTVPDLHLTPAIKTADSDSYVSQSCTTPTTTTMMLTLKSKFIEAESSTISPTIFKMPASTKIIKTTQLISPIKSTPKKYNFNGIFFFTPKNYVEENKFRKTTSVYINKINYLPYDSNYELFPNRYLSNYFYKLKTFKNDFDDSYDNY